jgi:hypothetical protein
MKCPNCGYEIQPPQPEVPYEYNGYLKPHLPAILDMLRAEKSPHEIAATLQVRSPWGSSPQSMIQYIARKYNLRLDHRFDEKDRNQEIVTRYLAGGIRLRDLAHEYNLSTTRTCQIIERAMKREERQAEAHRAFEQASDFEDMPIESLDLSVRALNCLRHKFATVGEVMKQSEAELLRIPNFGRGSLFEWKQCVRQLQREFETRNSYAG